jgi:acyl dehydratase
MSMDFEPIDTSDIDRWMGQPVGGEQLREPIAVSDLRRWVQAVHNPNPIHYDADWPAVREAGGLIAPQSLVLACSIRHGVQTSVQGTFPGVNQMNGGDAWWFFKTAAVGDLVKSVRTALDYRITETPFAGPTLFQRGLIDYVNQKGEVLARQRSTSIRYLQANFRKAAEARPKKAVSDEEKSGPVLTPEMIAGYDAERLAYARNLREAAPPTLADVTEGLEPPRRILGPHSVQSFTTEQRAFLYTIWGNLYDDGLPRTERRNVRWADGALDPYFTDGLYHGHSAGHTSSEAAASRGMPRAYGAGAVACAYIVDYAANWAGATGKVEHVDVQYRGPILVGDVTYISAKVKSVGAPEADGSGLVTLAVQAADQNGKVSTPGTVTVRLPARQ